mmetsp:Transcript_33646/g.78532  ORF Transcript_33646/g.78532 Transcript_33646/m.78532 type:complete len:477 (-) Transcript_33646:115-1545(-)
MGCGASKEAPKAAAPAATPAKPTAEPAKPVVTPADPPKASAAPAPAPAPAKAPSAPKDPEPVKSAPSATGGTYELPKIGDEKFDAWLSAQLAASGPDVKDTTDFRYLTFSEIPPFIDLHKSLMRKHLTPELFAKLKDIKSSKGYTLSNSIQAGVLRPHLGVGITCGDEECFELFKDILYPVVKGWHGFDPATQTHKSDLDPTKLTFPEDIASKFGTYVKSTRIRAARNIAGFSLPAGASVEDRLAVEGVLKEAFASLPEPLQGKYYPLGGLTSAQEDELQAGGFLFQKPGPMQLLGAAGAGRGWPDGRGIFHNDAKTALAWCNEEDHCRIISMQNGGDVWSVFARFCKISDTIKAAAVSNGAKLMESDRLGFLGTCPSNLGTGLRASVMIKLPELNKDPHALELICDEFDLQPRGSSGEHSAAVGGKWDISNKQRIGFTEVQLVQKMIDGITKIIAIEEKLVANPGMTPMQALKSV